MSLSRQLDDAAAFVRSRIGDRRPTIAMVLGSGLGAFADTFENSVAIDYGDIPGFLQSSVVGHAGRLVVGVCEGRMCAVMQGRVHYYEGHSAKELVFPVQTLIHLGCATLIVTNAAGSANPAITPGDLVLIRDHINLLPDHPLRGINEDDLGPRFPDMTRAYDRALRELCQSVANDLGIDLKEGVYAAMAGPSYETPAEVTMLRTLGVDTIGMSTVPEVIAANHMGAKVIGISCATNMAAAASNEPLSHDEVTETADRVKATFTRLVRAIVAKLPEAA